MPQTLTQKLLARAAGRERVTPGEVVDCRVDQTLGAPRDAGGAGSGEDRGLAALVESGQILPGMFCRVDPALAALSPIAGAFGAFGAVDAGDADGAAAPDAPASMRTTRPDAGRVRLAVPATRFMRWTGRLPDGVGASDMVLAMLGRPAARGGPPAVIEFCGEAVAALGMCDRVTLCSLHAGLGAGSGLQDTAAGLVAPDQVTRRWLDAVGADVDELGLNRWHSDEGAPGAWHSFDASGLAPLIGQPHDAAQARTVDDLGPLPVDTVCIGACTGAPLEDLRAAARVLAGYRIARGVRLLIAPASARTQAAAEREGILRRLAEAGATVLPCGRDPCEGLDGAARLASAGHGARFEALGTASPLYLGSPFTAAASALRGRVADAREVLG